MNFKTFFLLLITTMLALTGLSAMAWDDAGGSVETETPTPRLRIPRVVPTVDELTNPHLYYPRANEQYIEPIEYSDTPPPPGVRPGEFEEMDSVVITIKPYGDPFNTMWIRMLRAFVGGGHTYVVADEDFQETAAQMFEAGNVPEDAYTFFSVGSNSIWVRDYGPEFLRSEDNARHVIDAQYWPNRPLDDAIPIEVANSDWIRTDGEPLSVYSHAHYLNGGNVMTDGAGTCFFSNIIYGIENQTGLSDEEVDELMEQYLGCEQVITLNPIRLDITGHIDLYAKVMDPTSILLGEFVNSTFYEEDYLDQEANLAILEATTNMDGEPWTITRMPMPEPYYGSYGWTYRSYLNSQLFNDVLVMPTYYSPQEGETVDDLLDLEAQAIEAYETARPGVRVVPVDSDHIIEWGGAIHCIAHEVPEELEVVADTDTDTDTDTEIDTDTETETGASPAEDSEDDSCGCIAPGRSAMRGALFSRLLALLIF